MAPLNPERRAARSREGLAVKMESSLGGSESVETDSEMRFIAGEMRRRGVTRPRKGRSSDEGRSGGDGECLEGVASMIESSVSISSQ